MGINDYQDVADLPKSVWGAEHMRDAFYRFEGWPNGNINVLIDANATKNYINNAISTMPRIIGNTDVFYFAGHGMPGPGGIGVGIVTVEPQIITPGDLEYMFGSNYNQYAVFIDACRSGIFPNQMSHGVITSTCSAFEDSYQFNDIGPVYTHFILEGLTYNEASGSDHIMSAEDLFFYAKPRTDDYLLTNAQISDNYSGDLILLNPYLYVPQNYSSLLDAISYAVYGQTIVLSSGNYNISSNLNIPLGVSIQINNGATLTVNSGVTLSFQSGSSLNVYGTLNATNATFDRSGSSSWRGIIFNNGSSGSLSGCTIRNASHGITCNGVLPSISNSTISNNTIGIYLNNVYTTSTSIYGNTIHDNSGQGIGCYYSSVRIENNYLNNNGFCNVFCANSSPWFSGNQFSNSTYGVYLVNNSPAKFYPYSGGNGANVIVGNGTGIYADAGCNAVAQGNDVYAIGSGAYAINATNSCQVMVQNNWWGSYPAQQNQFVATNGAVIYYYPGASTPFTIFRLQKASAVTALNNNHANNTLTAGDTLIDANLLTAIKLMVNGKYDDAASLYMQSYNQSNNIAKLKYCLSQLAECYLVSGGNDFTGLPGTKVFSDVANNNVLSRAALQLENRFLVKKGLYAKSIDNLLTLKNTSGKNQTIVKNSLFDLGYINNSLLNKPEDAKQYFIELAAKYPDDILTLESKILLGDVDSAEIANHLKMAKEKQSNSVIAAAPDKYNLLQNYPNPFNPTTIINYQSPNDGYISLKIYDMLGREVKTLASGYKPEGKYSVEFNGGNLASGIYIYKINIIGTNGKNFTASKKLLLLK